MYVLMYNNYNCLASFTTNTNNSYAKYFTTKTNNGSQ